MDHQSRNTGHIQSVRNPEGFAGISYAIPEAKNSSVPTFVYASRVHIKKLVTTLCIDRSVKEVGWIHSGEKQAMKVLRRFLRHGLAEYAEARNDPNRNG